MKLVITIPAYNEELILGKSIVKLFSFCRDNLKLGWQIVIADNNSNDGTAVIAKKLAAEFPGVSYLFVGKKGKGIAIKTAWQENPADIYCFMDADLATDLSALPFLIKAIVAGGDVALGNRFDPQSKVKRSLIRKLVSQSYRLILKIFLGLKINDAPCGFKAINRPVAAELLGQTKNEEWFFDSELVILAEKKGYKIKEIPVIWQDPREGIDKSRVKTLALSWAYFKRVIELKRRLNQ